MKRLLPLLLALPLYAAAPAQTPAKPAPAPAKASLLDLSKAYVQNATVSVETFAAYSVDRGPFENVLRGNFEHGKFGTGLALNIDLGTHVFAQIDSIINAVDDVNGSTVDNSSVSLGLQFNTPLKVAPFALVGIGHRWDGDYWNTHAEAGLRLNLSKRVYASASYRHTFEEAADYGQVRAGLGYKF